MPLRPDLVVEVKYDHMEGTRFRHTAHWQALAPGPRAGVLHLRADRPPRTLRPGRDPRHGTLTGCAADVRTRRARVYTILLLSEKTLNEHDVRRIAELHGTEDVSRPPAGRRRRRPQPADRGAGRRRPRPAAGRPRRRRRARRRRRPSRRRCTRSTPRSTLLAAAGLPATGSITGSNPVPAAVEAARADDVDEVIVVTPPHLVESALHRDWASRLRDELAAAGAARRVRHRPRHQLTAAAVDPPTRPRNRCKAPSRRPSDGYLLRPRPPHPHHHLGTYHARDRTHPGRPRHAARRRADRSASCRPSPGRPPPRHRASAPRQTTTRLVVGARRPGRPPASPARPRRPAQPGPGRSGRLHSVSFAVPTADAARLRDRLAAPGGRDLGRRRAPPVVHRRAQRPPVPRAAHLPVGDGPPRGLGPRRHRPARRPDRRSSTPASTCGTPTSPARSSAPTTRSSAAPTYATSSATAPARRAWPRPRPTTASASPAPGATPRLLAVKVADVTGRIFTDDLAKGIVWAVDHGADVVNLSLGGPTSDRLEKAAVAYAQAHGVLVVAAAGNEGTSAKQFPGALPGVVAVGATSAAGSVAGAVLQLRPVGRRRRARAARSWWPAPGGGYEIADGTSYSAPLVSGSAALLLAARPDAPPPSSRRRSSAAADSARLGFAHGLVHVDRSLDLLAPGSAPTVTAPAERQRRQRPAHGLGDQHRPAGAARPGRPVARPSRRGRCRQRHLRDVRARRRPAGDRGRLQRRRPVQRARRTVAVTVDNAAPDASPHRRAGQEVRDDAAAGDRGRTRRRASGSPSTSAAAGVIDTTAPFAASPVAPSGSATARTPCSAVLCRSDGTVCDTGHVAAVPSGRPAAPGHQPRCRPRRSARTATAGGHAPRSPTGSTAGSRPRSSCGTRPAQVVYRTRARHPGRRHAHRDLERTC